MPFKASDGTEFQDRDAWRAYEFALMYTFKDLSSPSPPTAHTKNIASTSAYIKKDLSGQPFDMADCKNMELLLLDNTDQVQIDNCEGCRIFVAASSESVFVRDCKDCTFTLACKQLRTRDCVNCTFYLYSKTEPIIETSTGMKFAPFNGAFEGHAAAMQRAGLIPEHNLWFGVYDFNDEAKTNKNWCIMKQEDEEPLWTPLGPAESCCPRVTPGSISLPSQSGDGMGGGVTIPTTTTTTAPAPAPAPAAAAPPAGSGGMMSFTFDTDLSTAAALTGDAFVAQETQKKLSNPTDAAPKPPGGLKKSGVGWNPGAFAEPDPDPLSAKPLKKSSIGWNPNAFAEPDPAPVPAPAPVLAPAPAAPPVPPS